MISRLASAGIFCTPLTPAMPTGHPEAWRGPYVTVRLLAETLAVRVHNMPHRRGSWFAIDLARVQFSRYRDNYALPRDLATAEMDLYLLRPGTVLNIGAAERLGSRPGGGLQAEFVDGPRPMLHTGP